MDFVLNTILMGTATMEELSSTLAEQVNDQDRYALAETIIVAQVELRDKLLEEQKTMIEKIRGLEEKIAASRMDTVRYCTFQEPRAFQVHPPDTWHYGEL